MNIYEKFSKLKKLHKWFNSEKGFTLIEAVVTVAIVGAVITPIALIFQGALTSSILTRDQLKVTQLTQQYVEALEALEFDDIKTLVDTDGGIVDSSTAVTYGLPPLIDGTTVTVDLHYGDERTDNTPDPEYNTAFDTPDYELDPLTGLTLLSLDYDMFLHLDSSANDNVKIYNRSTPYAPLVLPVETFAGTNVDRQLVIRYEEDAGASGYRKVTVFRNTDDYFISYLITDVNNTVIVFCDDELTLPASKNDTYIEVENLTTDQVNVLVFETISDTIEPIVSIINGNVSTSRGLSEVDTSELTHRIFEIEVTVTKGTVTDHIVTTVIAK